MGIGSVLVSRLARSKALASSALSSSFNQASYHQLNGSHGTPLSSQRRMPALRAFSSQPFGNDVNGTGLGTTNSRGAAMQGITPNVEGARSPPSVGAVNPPRGRVIVNNLIDNLIKEDEQLSRRNKNDYVHVTLLNKKVFVTVTDAQGNRKTGASTGSLEERKGRTRLTRYAADAIAEQVGRSSRRIGVKSVVMKVKGYTFFTKKRKTIFAWRDGFRGEGVGARSRIVSLHDVTQLPHNGCRLPKRRRV